jgi:hypothetical protein
VMLSSRKVVFERLEKVLVKEKLGVKGLTDENVDVYAALLARQQLRISVGRFGVATRPEESAAKICLSSHPMIAPSNWRVEEPGKC